MAQAVETSVIGQPTKEISRLFPNQGEWTEADYFSLPETNQIVELSEGRLIISPSPTSKHQKALGNLFVTLKIYIQSKKLGEAVMSPMDTRLYEGVVRQPDIAFMSNKHLSRITDRMWGVPDLVVEVLSKGTAKEDKEEKYHQYQRAGIPEYWIVDPIRKSIIIYTLENGVYELLGKWVAGEIAKSKLLDGFEVSTDDIMA